MATNYQADLPPTNEQLWVDPDQVLPNPQHPRDGWEEVDDELALLTSSLQDLGQREACRVTPILPSEPEHADGYRYRLADGHRRHLVARRGRLQLLVEVEVDEETGAPLRPMSLLSYWFMHHATRAVPTTDLVVCLARMRKAWDQEHEQDQKPFPSVRRFAELMGTSTASAGRILQVVREPEPVVQAVATRLLPVQAILLLIKEVPEPAERALLVQDLAAEQAKRTKLGQGPLTVSEIQARLAPVTAASPDPTPRQLGHEFPFRIPVQAAPATVPLVADEDTPPARLVSGRAGGEETTEPTGWDSTEQVTQASRVLSMAQRLRLAVATYEELVFEEVALPTVLTTVLDELCAPSVRAALDALVSSEEVTA